MRKKHLGLQVLLALLLTATVIFGVEGVCNLPLNRLPEGQRGEIALDLSGAVVTASAAEDGLAEEDYDELDDLDDLDEADDIDDLGETDEPAEENVPVSNTLNLSGAAYADLDWQGYVHQLRLEGAPSSDSANTGVSYTVDCTLTDGSVVTYRSIFSTAVDADNVAIDKEITHLRVQLQDGGANLTGIVVDNAARMQPRRMLFSGLIAAAVCLLWLLRELIGRKPEYGFLIVALCCGIFLCVALPPFSGLSYDDQIHFDYTWAVSWGKEVKMTDSAESLTSFSWSYQDGDSIMDPADTAADHDRLIAVLDRPESNEINENSRTYENQWRLMFTGYVAEALGLWLGRVLGLPMSGQVILCRLVGMLAYVLLCFAAIHKLKRFKLTFAALALMPTPMFMASNFSYDPLCTGFCFLGAALAIDAMMERYTRLSWQRLLVIFVCFLLASTIKAVYAPMLLLVLLLPRSKFASKQQAVYVKLAAMVVMGLAVGGILLNISGDINALQDSRGDGADSVAQVAFILSHPLTYLVYFFKAIFDNFEHYFLSTDRNLWGYIGGMGGTWSLLGLGLMLFTFFTDNDPAMNQRLSWQQRVGVLLVGGVTVGLMFTSMYVGYSAVGSSSFGGVQGRYLQPILPLLFLTLSPNGIKNEMNKTGWHLCFCLGNLTILMLACGQLVLTNLMR